MSPAPRLVPGLLVLVLAAAGCSGSVDVDTDAVRAGLGERAAAAYDDEGLDRAEDFQRGVRTSCLVLDDAGVDAVGAAVGIDDPEARAGFVAGPEDAERASCTLRDPAGRSAGVTVGTTDLDRAALVEVGTGEGRRVVEGEAEGLDEEHYVGFGNEDATVVTWVRDGVTASITVPTDVAGADAVFAALPVLLEEVDRELGD
ncbi:hypothetical protein [Nocardioides litoris]|uniref:hypothetical protein n=1 Tax=Nocardioides litoris TaxID=1926648 RepID=UPI0011203B42|nr:hypothetical protein [Nocardioides litoris]